MISCTRSKNTLSGVTKKQPFKNKYKKVSESDSSLILYPFNSDTQTCILCQVKLGRVFNVKFLLPKLCKRSAQSAIPF